MSASLGGLGDVYKRQVLVAQRYGYVSQDRLMQCCARDSVDRFGQRSAYAVSYTHLTLPTICSV
eukprot:11943884-Alexandrium_andersonii.AAC.1